MKGPVGDPHGTKDQDDPAGGQQNQYHISIAEGQADLIQYGFVGGQRQQGQIAGKAFVYKHAVVGVNGVAAGFFYQAVQIGPDGIRMNAGNYPVVRGDKANGGDAVKTACFQGCLKILGTDDIENGVGFHIAL